MIRLSSHLVSYTVIIFAVGLMPASSNADPIDLVQHPAGTSVPQPAPNIVVSVDDSSSMGESGMKSLREALLSTFYNKSVVPSGSVRLAWQSMNRCPNIPSNSADCKGLNRMRILDDEHRQDFRDWVDTLIYRSGQGTPSHIMVRNAGNYLMRTDLGKDSPWAEVPGTIVGNMLGCRRAYHIFMTDGSWNSSATHTANHIDADRDRTGYEAEGPFARNIDNSPITLPDNTAYDPENNQTKIYQDPWGGPYQITERICTGPSWNRTCRDQTVTESINTLSDLAFYYWATDLQPSLRSDDEKENVPEVTRIAKTETITGSNGKKIDLDPYWNPQNDPATWRHLNTYTIGFGDATNWKESSNRNAKDLLNWTGNMYGGSYADLVVGNEEWPSPLCDGSNASKTGTQPCDGSTAYGNQNNAGHRRTELWHMAINGRGKFIPASTGTDLSNAFKDIVSTIREEQVRPTVSVAAGQSSISTHGARIYEAGFQAKNWTGNIAARVIGKNQLDGTADYDTEWGSTQEKLDSMDFNSRNIISHDGSRGVIFRYANLSTAQQALLASELSTGASTSDRAQFGSAIVDFIRGDRSNEGKTVQDKLFRERETRQGDIVNSLMWYTAAPPYGYTLPGYPAFVSENVNRTPMLYVGGNDGMLHGFSADDATEKFAYIPQGVLANLPKLTDTGYTHRYFVDGSPFTGDVKTGSGNAASDWNTYLVGTLGAGGKGYFILDVTNPTNFGPNDVKLDHTYGVDPDVGYILADPVMDEFNSQIASQITRMNNGKWGVILGNGVNSENERPVLLIQYFDGTVKKLVAASSGDRAEGNGLSAPRPVDLNGDGTPDIIYAGDMLGNLWKFDVSSANDAEWHVAFDSNPLYTATSETGSVDQSITTAPLVRMRRSGKGGLMVAFGTGRDYTEGDRTDTTQQTFYSIWDRANYKVRDDDNTKVAEFESESTPKAPPAGSGRDDLVARTFNANSIEFAEGDSDKQYWNMEEQQDELDYEDGLLGWYFDLPGDDEFASSERIIRNPRFFRGGSNIIEILSDRPASGEIVEGESCAPPPVQPKAWRTLLGIEFGLKPTVQLLDANGDGMYSQEWDELNLDKNANRSTASPVEVVFSAKGRQVRVGDDGQIEQVNDLPSPSVMVNWRQYR